MGHLAKEYLDKAAGAGGGSWGWLHAPLVLILVVYGKPDLNHIIQYVIVVKLESY